MQVLQLNVRGRSGGAATVARELQQEYHRTNAAQSVLWYGYESGGKKDLELERNDIAIRSAPRLARLVGNRLAFPFLGVDPFVGSDIGLLRHAWQEADVVHLHAVHSYWLPLEVLVQLQEDHPRPVVWTMHDEWALTGRCAFTAGCRLWLDGCKVCPDLRAYPPARIDRTKINRPKRLEAIRFVVGDGEMVAVADWQADNLRRVYPDVHVSVINNGIRAPASRPARVTPSSNRGLIVGADLTSEVKFDWTLIARLVSAGAALDAIGRNSPPVAGITARGGMSRDNLLMAYCEYAYMLFTSRVDLFPMAVVEALCMGLPVLAVTSPAADEVLGKVGGRTVRADDAHLWLANPLALFEAESRQSLAQRAREAFDVGRQAKSYLEVYAAAERRFSRRYPPSSGS